MERSLPDLFTKELSADERTMLQRLCETYDDIPILMLFEQVDARLKELGEAKDAGEAVNIGMAEAIYGSLKAVAEKWLHLDGDKKYWLKGAFGYFIADDDEVSDFDSEAGFMDDLEIVNACLRFAELNELTIDPFDY